MDMVLVIQISMDFKFKLIPQQVDRIAAVKLTGNFIWWHDDINKRLHT